MSNFIRSVNMGYPIPIPSQAPGPEYALDISVCLTYLDSHDHSTGQGMRISTAGMNINNDLAFNSNNAISLRSARFNSQSAVLSVANDLLCLYAVGADLYYNDGSGNNVRLTQSGGVAGTSGSISSLTSPASASYVSANSTFVFQSAANTPAYLDGASLLLRNLSANSKSLTLNPPAAMASNIAMTLPSLPAAQSFLAMDTSGNISNYAPVSGGITTAMISPSAGITGSQLSASAAILGSQIVSSVVLSGTPSIAVALRIGGCATLVSDSPSTNNYRLYYQFNSTGSSLIPSGTRFETNPMLIIRGFINGIAGASIVSGSGFGVVRNSLGNYTITFAQTFADIPSVTFSAGGTGAACFPAFTTLSQTAITIINGIGSPNDCYICFQAIGRLY